MKKEYEVLFTPCKIGSLEIKNRFVVPAMSFTDVITWSNHSQTENKIEDFLIRKAKDGVGCFVFGCLYVFSQTNVNDWLYNHPELFKDVPKLMDTLHSYGTKAIQQLGFGAGKAYIMPPFLQDKYDTDETVKQNADMMMASADEGLPNRWTPERKTTYLTKERIQEIIHGLAETAYLCKINGIDGVEVHASHEGYMLDQFIAPYCNHRTDEYGGSLENRLRFACEIVKAIKEKCGEDYPVLIRYSLVSKTKDFSKGIIPQDKESIEIGKTIEESQQAMRILSEAGYDAFDVDNGTYDSWYYPHPPVYMPLNCNLKEAIAVKPFTDKPIICSGRMQPDVAAEAIRSGKLDFLGIGRQNLVEENYVTKLYEGKDEDIRPCISCHLGCMPISLWKNKCTFGQLGNCALNPHAGHEAQWDKIPAPAVKKEIAVIGAGIAGLEFALRATERGHNVTVYEKGKRIGGIFNEAAAFTFKEKDKELLAYYKRQIEKNNIKVCFETEIKDIYDIKADEYVIATGSMGPNRLHILGSERFITAQDYIASGCEEGENIVIIGGGVTGCEIAYELACKGKKPVIVEVQDDILIAPGSSMANTSFLRDAFEYYNVPIYTSAKTVSATEQTITIETAEGKEINLKADVVVQSIGFKKGIPFELPENVNNVHIIGDAVKVSNLLNAVHTAYKLAMTI
ncbi:MAG: FAD-dependent oxidoreductase [Eubacteriales bacterium]|nr:FAD-dependent oxidoreductase [Eubacteriales bacterium]